MNTMTLTGITRDHELASRELPEDGTKWRFIIWCSCGDSWATTSGDMQAIARRHQDFIDSFQGSATYMAKVCRI